MNTEGPGSDARPDCQALKILVADDNRTNRTLIARVLERAGHSVTTVVDGTETVEALARQEFDVAVVSDDLPGIEGLESLKLLRLAAVGRPRVPIVLVAADVSPAARARHAEAGVDTALGRPVDPRQLLTAVAAFSPSAEAPGAASDGDTVTALAAHPRFKPNAPPAVDARTLSDLQALGGLEFVRDLVEGFVADSGEVLVALREAVQAQDVTAFRDQLHALRSGAANIGAQEIYALCLAWRSIEPGELRERGAGHIERLDAELDRARGDLRRHIAGAPADEPRQAGVAGP